MSFALVYPLTYTCNMHGATRVALQVAVKVLVFLPDLDVLHVVFAAKIPSATAKAIHARNPETAITVNPRSKPDRLFHHVGFLRRNGKMKDTT